MGYENKLQFVHITKNGKWYSTNYDASIERLNKEFDSYLEKALLVGMPGDDLKYLMDVANKNKGRLIPIAPIVFNKNTSIEEIEKQIIDFKNRGFKGIKIHPRFLNTNLSDKKIIDSIRIAGKYNLVSMLCTIHRYPSPPLKRPVHDVLYEICYKTQNSKLILLHGGYYDLLSTSELIRNFESVLLDLSLISIRFKNTSLKNDIQFLFETFDKRICVGSDFPEYTTTDLVKTLLNDYNFQFVNIEKKSNILYNNLDSFFKGLI